MDTSRFDDLARHLAGIGSRRSLVRGLFGGGALLAVSRLAQLAAEARRGTSGAGDPCRHDDQCIAADTSLYCAWNGFGHDGDLNCCADAGSRCGDDRGCCGYSACDGGWCSDTGGSVVSAGNGGFATADASGGGVSIGNINSGGNVGNMIRVGNTQGDVDIAGGYVANDTGVSVTADGGVAIAEAGGGDGNIAGPGSSVDYDPAPGCSGEGCWCRQGQNDDDPCDYGLVCCHQSDDSSGTCITLYDCTGYGAPGDVCPAYCGPGESCPSCVSGYCSWSGYCG